MLALRQALLNARWSESWIDQLRLRVRQQLLQRRTRQQQRFRQQQARGQPSQPPPPAPAAPVPARQKTGRTEAQKRFGRQTFSLRMLKQAGGAK